MGEQAVPHGERRIIDRLVAAEGDRLCYSRSGWQRYEAGVWRTLERSVGQHVPYRVVRAADAGEFAYRWSLVNEVHNGAAIELAKPADIWDQDPDKLVFTNVTLNLKTFEPEPHSPLNYITAGVPYAYDPEARGPYWDRYLAYLREHPEVGAEVVDFLMEYLGYCLTADTSAEIMLFLVGSRGSGKSTFIEGAEAMLGRELCMTQSVAGLQERFQALRHLLPHGSQSTAWRAGQKGGPREHCRPSQSPTARDSSGRLHSSARSALHSSSSYSAQGGLRLVLEGRRWRDGIEVGRRWTFDAQHLMVFGGETHFR